MKFPIFKIFGIMITFISLTCTSIPSYSDDSRFIVHECDLLTSAPYDEDSIIRPASNYEVIKNNPQAIEACEAAIEQHPSVARYKFQLARALLVGWFDNQLFADARAINLLKEALNKDYNAANFLLGKWYVGGVIYNQLDFELGEKYLTTYMQQSINDTYAHELLGRVKSHKYRFRKTNLSSDQISKKQKLRKEIVSHYVEAVGGGSVDALYRLGKFYIRDQNSIKQGELLANVAVSLGSNVGLSGVLCAKVCGRKQLSETDILWTRDLILLVRNIGGSVTLPSIEGDFQKNTGIDPDDSGQMNADLLHPEFPDSLKLNYIIDDLTELLEN